MINGEKKLSIQQKQYITEIPRSSKYRTILKK